jgi:ATP synthase protein I
VLGPDGGKQLKAFARVGALGIELAISTVIGLLAGRWLDSKLSTGPWLTLVGLLLGVSAGFRSLYITARKQTLSPPPDKPPPPADKHE